ncbi:MAG: hypothetical protein K6F58_05250 [Bacteroidales bacterium]|nr:hypothetical protein [Bacteroidales bacterium]
MKKSFKLFVTLAAAAIALIACSKAEISAPVNPDEDGIPVIINTGAPVTMTMMSGTTPYWCDGDAIGVTNGSSDKQNKFNEYSIEAGLTATSATFSGSVASTGTYYAYYPYTSNGVTASGCAKADIPATQNPTATSFDGKADLMVSKSFTVSTTETTTINNLEFARLCAIVKVVLIDGSGTYDLSGEHPASVSLTAASNLVGRVYLDMVNQELGELYYGQSATVNAAYTESTKYLINGSNATYLIVYPQTLAAGSTLTVAAETENYAISKEITVPAGDIDLVGGQVTTLNITLADAHITPSSSGDPLPFDDDMAWANNGASDGTTNIASTVASVSSSMYSSAAYLYKGIGGAKLGSGSYAGSITTKDLDLSGAFYIAIEAGQFNTDTGSILVSIDDDDPVISSNDFSDVLYANVSAGTYTKKSKVTIATSSKRGRIYSVEIASGTYVPSPRINVTSSNPMAVSNENDLHAIEYTISNPSGASISASANVAWIHDFDYSVAGEVSFEVDAQTAGDPARSGNITLSYTGADNVVVVVNQAAGAGGGPSLQYTLTPTAGSDNSYAGSEDIVVDKITWNVTGNATLTPWRLGGKSITNTDRVIYSKTAISANISQIVITNGATSGSITVNSMKVYVCSTAAGAAASTPTNVVASFTPEYVANDDVTINKADDTSWANCYYRIVYNVTVSGSKNKYIEFSEAKFYGTN